MNRRPGGQRRRSSAQKLSPTVTSVTLIRIGSLLSVASQIARGTDVMKAPTSEYRREAARLRALIAEATTARARQHLGRSRFA